MNKLLTKYVVAFVLLSACATQKPASWTPDYPIDRFESVIRKFEAADSAAMPAPNAIVLTGSSSFALWDSAARDLAPLPVINRGFGGSTLPEVIHYVDRSVLKYSPEKVVVYCENDMFGEKPKTPEDVRDDYRTLVEHIEKKNSKARIYYISMKPSPLRWSSWDKVKKANALIKEVIDTDPRQTYIDITQVMLKNGRPDGSIYKSDSLHMLPAGYERWVPVIKSALSK